LLPGRSGSSNNYRFGFNGKEKDDEIDGVTGSKLDFGARIYDSRIARFLSVDPRVKDFPFWSPYLYAANNPVRYVDVNGEGPGDRVKKAESYKGTKYKQQGEWKDKARTSLRTGSSAAALEFMDCSELVCRVLAADNITPKIKSMNTGALITFFNDSKKFHKSETPISGDVVLWNGHTGIVKDYDSETKKVTVVHATKYENKDGTSVESVVTEKYKLSYYKKKKANFYRPKSESAEGKVSSENKGSSSSSSDDHLLPVLMQIINEEREARESKSNDNSSTQTEL